MDEGAKDVAIVGTGKSRLPAGSTLEVTPGVHVPHPEAEVNLPGVPDPRLGETAAVTEDGDGNKRPLADEVKPKVLTATNGAAVAREGVEANLELQNEAPDSGKQVAAGENSDTNS